MRLRSITDLIYNNFINMKDRLRILSLYELKSWNAAYRGKQPLAEADLPITLEWLLDYFFDEAIPKGEAWEAYNAFIDFAMICNNVGYVKAKEHVNSSLRYWNNRASKDKDLYLTELFYKEPIAIKSSISGTFAYNDGKLDFVCKTFGVEFNEVLEAITALRDECNRQIGEQNKCPHKPREAKSLEQPCDAGGRCTGEDMHEGVCDCRNMGLL